MRSSRRSGELFDVLIYWSMIGTWNKYLNGLVLVLFGNPLNQARLEFYVVLGA